MKTEKTNIFVKIIKDSSILIGISTSLWAVAAFISGLSAVNWQFSELLRQYLVAIGVMKEFHTFVDFYTHIKGVEYIICGLFLCGFPLFYKMLHKPAEEAETA